MSTAAIIAQRLEAKGPKRNGWWEACCPFHDDKNPSFGFTEEGFKCQGCGEHGHINKLAEHLGIEVRSTNGRGAQLTTDDADRLLHNRGLRAETIQRFCIESDVQRQVWRFPMGNGRAFKLKRFDGEKPKCKWDPPGSAGGAELYGLPGALKIDPDDVLLVEGEPDVWICQQAGLPAVSFTAGAETVPDAGVLKLIQVGVQQVRVIYDRDEPGEAGRWKAASALQAAGIEVEVLDLPDSLPPGGDLTNLYNLMERNDADFREVVASLDAAEIPTEGAAPGFPAPISLGELVATPVPEVDFLATPIIPAGGNVLIAGYPKSFKTFFALDLAVSVAAGTRFLGQFHTGKRRRVGVVLMEGMKWQAGNRLARAVSGPRSCCW